MLKATSRLFMSRESGRGAGGGAGRRPSRENAIAAQDATLSMA
jgi:hypothetical protein